MRLQCQTYGCCTCFALLQVKGISYREWEHCTAAEKAALAPFKDGMAEMVAMATFSGGVPVPTCLATPHSLHSEADLQIALACMALIQVKAQSIAWCSRCNGGTALIYGADDGLCRACTRAVAAQAAAGGNV